MKRPTVLAATDFSPLGRLAVEAGAAIAHRMERGRLAVIHVVNATTATMVAPYSYTEAQLAQVGERAQEIARGKLSAERKGDETVERIVRLGAPAKEIAEVARELDVEIIVVASHGHGGFLRAVLGSVSSALIRTADHPVLVVGEHRTATQPFKRVVAAVDLSPVSERVLRSAIKMVAPGGCVTVLSFYEPPFVAYAEDAGVPPWSTTEELQARAEEHRIAVQELVDGMRFGDFDIELEVHGHLGPPRAILDHLDLKMADLAVVGTSGHNAWSRFILGSTATRVIAEARCPVLVVPFGHPPAA